MTVTSSEPSRRNAWAISTPMAPPPRTTNRRGISLTAVTSRLSHGEASARPSIGGMAGTVPQATTTACRAVSVRVPPPSASSTSTVFGPARRPWPRTSSIPVESSHGVWVRSLQSLVM